MYPCLIEAEESPVDGAHVWTANLDAITAAEHEQLSGNLCVSERDRAARFHFERDRKYYVATRGLLRALLGSILDQAPSALVFEYGPHGKPALAESGQAAPTIRFNLSHATGRAMFAIAREREVGIDLEAAARLERDEQHLSHLAAAVLSAREMEFWQQLPHPGARRAALLRAWTRKEAYAKATGRGMSEGLQRIEVALDLAEPQRTLPVFRPPQGTSLPSSWLLYDLAAPEGFAAALAVEVRDGPALLD